METFVQNKTEAPAVKEGDVDVRESMRNLPNFLQGFLTWQTGKPLEGQMPHWKRGRLSHFYTAYFILFLGVLLSVLGIILSGILLPVGWLLTVSGARKLVTTINHYCVHKDALPTWLQKSFGNYMSHIANFNSALLFLQNFAEYKNEHNTHHNPQKTASLADPDMQFLWHLGFRAGMDKHKLWKKYIMTLFSPYFHFIFLKARIKTNLVAPSWGRKTVAVLFLLIPFVIGYYTSFMVVFWAWYFPLFYLYHIASLMQFSSEHFWLKETNSIGKVHSSETKQLISRSKRLTVGRFCGERVPQTKNKSIFEFTILWSIWWFRMFFYHLPIRLFVLPGDLPQHDWHHRCGFGADWANAVYARQAMIQDLRPDEEPFVEVWGFTNAIDLVFTHLSEMEPLKIDEQVPINLAEMVLGM